ncbi:MAG: hypothetical protein DRJ42_27625 [Deltaproteobacteria bacterium]|nr:MAG: hypothetical protein DRJ42_27625 [Deltaproteobacteria bacterium]
MKLYFLSYFSYRFFTEWLRPEPNLALGLTLYQWTSLVFIVVFAALWYRDSRAQDRQRATGADASPNPL